MATTKSDELAEIDGGNFPSEPSLFLHLEQGLKKSPNEQAIISTHQKADYLKEFLDPHNLPLLTNDKNACLIWTYRQLHGAAMRLATVLLARGIRTGSVLVTLIPQGIEWCLWVWTAAIMKLTMAPLDFGALDEGREAEMQHFMTQINPAIVVVPNASGANAVEAAFPTFAVTRPFGITTSNDAVDRWTPLSSLARHESADFTVLQEDLLTAARKPDPERIALILFTSGTSSGKPKGCLLRVESIAYHVDVQQMGPRATDTSSRCMIQSTNFRAIAQTVLLSCWTAGGTVVFPGISASAERILTVAENHHVTHMLFVPALIHTIAVQLSLKRYDLSSVTSISLGGDIITRDVLAKAQALVPSALVSTAHGMTEGEGLFQWPFSKTSLAKVPYYNEISPLGKVSPGARVRIWDTDNLRVAVKGRPGELHLSCVSMTREYLGGVYRDSFYEEDGRKWFKTGDLAIINSDGLVYILARIKDVVKRAGVPITPAALECCIEKYTGSQAIVVGISSPTLGQEPYAVLLSFAGKTEEDIMEHVIRSFGPEYALAGAKTLQDLEMRDFPVNATGKIMKSDVVKTVEASRL